MDSRPSNSSPSSSRHTNSGQDVKLIGSVTPRGMGAKFYLYQLRGLARDESPRKQLGILDNSICRTHYHHNASTRNSELRSVNTDKLVRFRTRGKNSKRADSAVPTYHNKWDIERIELNLYKQLQDVGRHHVAEVTFLDSFCERINHIWAQ